LVICKNTSFAVYCILYFISAAVPKIEKSEEFSFSFSCSLSDIYIYMLISIHFSGPHATECKTLLRIYTNSQKNALTRAHHHACSVLGNNIIIIITPRPAHVRQMLLFLFLRAVMTTTTIMYICIYESAAVY